MHRGSHYVNHITGHFGAIVYQKGVFFTQLRNKDGRCIRTVKESQMSISVNVDIWTNLNFSVDDQSVRRMQAEKSISSVLSLAFDSPIVNFELYGLIFSGIFHFFELTLFT